MGEFHVKIFLLLLCVSLAGLPLAEVCAKEKDKKSKRTKVRWDLSLDSKFLYDSNIFSLSEDQIDRLEDDRADDKVSGRFDDMESPDDLILSPRARASLRFPLLWGKGFSVEPRARYDFYIQNPKRSHPRVGLNLEQKLGGGQSLSLNFGYALDVFRRNYLADAIDTTGSVSADERVYEEGIYDEARVDLLYRARLWKAKKNAKFLREVNLITRLGYANRIYESPFDNRDRHTLRAGLRVGLKLTKWLDLDGGYLFEYVMSPGGEEVVIRDESDFGVDLNGDLDALDDNIRTEQKVDRSNFKHGFRVGLGIKFAKNWELGLGYRLRLEDFQSDEEFDLTFRNRKDIRHEARVGLTWDINKVLRLALDGRYLKEQSNRDTMDDNEEREYEKFIVSFTIAARF